MEGKMSPKSLTLFATGDMFARTKDDWGFSLVAPILKKGDVVTGQCEGWCTLRPVVTAARSFLNDATGIVQPVDPKNLKIFCTAGFNMLHLAGNHVWDLGVPGIEDTIAELDKLGMAHCGAGMNIDEARKPVIIERGETRFGFLSYNCTGPRETYANPDKPGCAYVHIIDAYENTQPSPGHTPSVFTVAEPRSLRAMVDDVIKLRPLCDVLTVHFHKGVGYTPIKIAMYYQQVSYAAIDAGADLIVAEHAHILKGIEQYKGKTIYHGLANFTPGARPVPGAPPPVDTRPAWVLEQRKERNKELYNIDVKPGREILPDAKKTIIAKCTIDNGKITKVGYLPCITNNQGQLEILKKSDVRGQQVFRYMDKITKEADLNARYRWEGDEVVIHS
jgi:hypothetical protein